MKTETWLEKNLPDQRRPLSQSGIFNALRCQRFFLYRHKWGIIKKVEKYKPAATFGRMLHSMLEAGRDNVQVVREQMIKDYSTLMDRIKAGEDLDGYLTMAAKEIGDVYNKALAVATIYWDKFPPKEHMKTVARELVMQAERIAPLTHNPVPLVGILDWVVEDTRNGNIWIRDTKTTSQSFEYKLAGLEFGLQGRFYRLLCHKTQKWGDRVKGFILDMVKTPTIKLCNKDITTANEQHISPEEAYKDRVVEWYETQEQVMESHALMFLNEKPENPELEGALNMACRLWDAPCNPQMFARDITTSKCTDYRSVCPYYPLCSSSMATWPAQIEQFYKVREDTAGANEEEVKEE